MITPADKIQENKNKAVANSLPKLQNNSKSAFQFVDIRPEAIAQRKLQDAINNSSRVEQLKAYQQLANNFTSQTTQRKENLEEETLQGKFASIQKKENNTGLPDNLKSGIESLSGMSMDHVKVHYNSSQPAQLNAHAYAQGSEIHVAPGQEQHVPHEAWHVVQQAQGRVKPTMQMKPVQLKSQVFTQQDQSYNYGTGSINVGQVMEVGLDPNDMKHGQSANLNTSQDPMMSEIRQQWGIKGGALVKGHLWNDNLGGSAMNYNLYPITKAANSDHLGYVENKAKEYIWQHQQPIYYKVEVDGTPDINSAKAEFDCEIRAWNPNTNKLGNLLFGPVTIVSDLNDVGAYNEAYETYTGNPADRQKRPKKPKWATSPKTKVGELSKQEVWDRLHQ